MLIELNLAGKRLVVDTAKLTGRKYEQLGNEFVAVKKNYTIQGRFPPEKDETEEDYKKRVVKLLEEEQGKREDESLQEYIERVEKPNLDNYKIQCDAVKAIARCFDQEDRVNNDEVFLDTSYVEMKEFIKKVLNLMDLNEEYFNAEI